MVFLHSAHGPRVRCRFASASVGGRRRRAIALAAALSGAFSGVFPGAAAVAAPGESDAFRPSAPGQADRVLAEDVRLPASVGVDPSFVVRLARPLEEHERAELSALGVRFIRALGGGSHLVSMAPEAGGRVALDAMELFIESKEHDAGAKLHRLLDQGFVPSWAVVETRGEAGRRLVALNVLFHPDVDLDAHAAEIVDGFGGRIFSRIRSLNGLVVLLPEEAIEGLAALPEILLIEPPLPKFQAMNAENRLLTQAEQAQAPPYNLDGSGVSVLLYDTGIANADHPDFGGRLTPYPVSPNTNPAAHPTHVGGTIGGDGAQSGGLHRGMAPGVIIHSYELGGWALPDPPMAIDLLDIFFADAGNLEDVYFEAITQHDTAVANNSIGINLFFFSDIPVACLYYAEYGVSAALIDSLARGEVVPPIILSWAAGNPRRAEPMICGLEYGNLSPPSNAKNSIVVGAVHADTDEITDFSAFGPTLDGRLKPDISAPGCQMGGDEGVTSLSVQGGYLTACGTSMAAPTVTGLIALMLQDHRAQNPGEPDFLNSTAKAVLVQTAVDIGPPGPDFTSGYGSVRVREAIDLMRRGDFAELEVEQSAVVTRSIVVGEKDEELKITIAWDDPPGAPSSIAGSDASPKLVNDLDLHVYSPGGVRRYPWTLDPTNPTALAVQNQPDRLNNIEQVLVENPEPGKWVVEVHGYDVPVGPQVFSIAASHMLLSTSCPADLTGDGQVGSADLAMLLGDWGAADSPADLTGDGQVGSGDLAILLGSWGPCP